MRRYGLFQSGSFAYAIDLEQIEKILQSAVFFDLPLLPGGVIAILVDVGRLIPLFDFVKIFGDSALQEQNQPIYQVFVSTEYGTVALPASMSGRIVAISKGIEIQGADNVVGEVGKFIYKNEEYNILDINYLALEMTQGFWQN